MSNLQKQFDSYYKKLQQSVVYFISTLRLLEQNRDTLLVLYVQRVQETMDTTENSMKDIMDIVQEDLIEIDKKIRTIIMESKKIERFMDIEINIRDTNIKTLQDFEACLQLIRDIPEYNIEDLRTELLEIQVDATIEGNMEIANKIKQVDNLLEDFVMNATDLNEMLVEMYELELPELEERFPD